MKIFLLQCLPIKICYSFDETPQRLAQALRTNETICETKVWLILILMIIKQGLELMIIFQVWLGKKIFKLAITKTKSSQREINKKKNISKRSVFQDLNFIGSLCKVGALGFFMHYNIYLCTKIIQELFCFKYFKIRWFHVRFFMHYIIYLYTKSSKSYFVLNILKSDDFMFLTKILCQMLSNFV